MIANTNAAVVPSIGPSLEHLSDVELLSTTRTLVGRSNQLLAALLAHLGEVEARGIHRTRACASLYIYCIYELRLSEDEAYRRVAAARLVRRFPALFEAVAAGELHLTGLLMLGPHLTDDNLLPVLARAKHRTKKEIARLVRQLDPLPDVPSRIEPLGPAPARLVLRGATWKALVDSVAPVRELRPGDRPRDWMSEPEDSEGANGVEVEETAPAPARIESVEPAAPQRYKVQFTSTEEYVSLVERAKALLSHSDPGVEIEEIQLRALRAYVAELEKKKFAVTDRPKKRKSDETAKGNPRQRVVS
jgi:hypothetical protein